MTLDILILAITIAWIAVIFGGLVVTAAKLAPRLTCLHTPQRHRRQRVAAGRRGIGGNHASHSRHRRFCCNATLLKFNSRSAEAIGFAESYFN